MGHDESKTVGLDVARARADAAMRGHAPPEPPPAPDATAARERAQQDEATRQRMRQAALARESDALVEGRQIADHLASLEQQLRNAAERLGDLRGRARAAVLTTPNDILAAALLVGEARTLALSARRLAEDVGAVRQQRHHVGLIARAADAEATAPLDSLSQARAFANLRTSPPVERPESICAEFSLPSPNATDAVLMGGENAATKAAQLLRLAVFSPAVASIT